MSKKHVDEYYQLICKDFDDMVEVLHEIEEEYSNHIVGPEKIEEIKQIIEPLKNNKARWDYMMFLLNQPNKKNKQIKYYKQQKSRLDASIKNQGLQDFSEGAKSILELRKLKRDISK